MEKLASLGFLLVATTMEGKRRCPRPDGLGQGALGIRIALFAMGAVLLFGYGPMLNLAPLEFGRVVGLYIATLFVVWQFLNLIAFGSAPSLPILIGGTLIVAGGLIVTFWEPGAVS